MNRPRIAVTMGDVAGIGPEIIARGWRELTMIASPIVIGDPRWLQIALDTIQMPTEVQDFRGKKIPDAVAEVIQCLPASAADLTDVTPGQLNAQAGRAAYDYLITGIKLAMSGAVDAIVTCPLHKEGLHLAGLPFPGHTEILAAQTNAARHAMLLFGDNLAVAHVTLHTALRDALPQITTSSVKDSIELLNELLPRLIDRQPRIAVCALNPHASDGGLFGIEEAQLIAPAVKQCQELGVNVAGPLPADALWAQAASGAYDGVVAMYHDQGHIPMKMRSGRRLVNITAGLPIIRTSVAHGTAYDIAGQGKADASSLIAAAEVAVKLARSRK